LTEESADRKGCSDNGFAMPVYRYCYVWRGPAGLIPRRTPWVSILFTTLVVMVLIATGDIAENAKATVLLLLLVFIVINVSVFVLRRDRIEHQHFRTPGIFPVLGILVCLALLTQQERATFLRAGALLLIGLVLWGVNYLTKRLLDDRAPEIQ
jgi:APA family basic amino acid/polyamine antiporter